MNPVKAMLDEKDYTLVIFINQSGQGKSKIDPELREFAHFLKYFAEYSGFDVEVKLSIKNPGLERLPAALGQLFGSSLKAALTRQPMDLITGGEECPIINH